ncbi:hypothetical protein ADL26_11755, partial [Thermoactinomyces vulgaris]
GDDGELGAVDLGAHVVREDGEGEEVVDGAVEEALDLGGVEVHGEDAVGAGGLEQVGHEARGDGLAAAVLLVLAGVAVERDDHGDAPGGGPLQSIDHDQLFHDPLVDRGGVALHQEAVRAARRLLEPHVDLTVGEIECLGRYET